MVDRPEREKLIRAHLSYLGFDLEQEFGGLDWIVKDWREGHGVLRALQPSGAVVGNQLSTYLN
jgi:hypothetical protein